VHATWAEPAVVSQEQRTVDAAGTAPTAEGASSAVDLALARSSEAAERVAACSSEQVAEQRPSGSAAVVRVAACPEDVGSAAAVLPSEAFPVGTPSAAAARSDD
jgi:hypothetical protein